MTSTAPTGRQPHTTTTTRPPRVLLVDPYDRVRDATLNLLDEEGMTGTATADGDEALTIARREPFTVALIDLSVGVYGGLHGIQVASALLDLDPAPAVLFLSVTSVTSDGCIYLNYRMIPVIPKGDPTALVKALHEAHAAHPGHDDRDGEGVL